MSKKVTTTYAEPSELTPEAQKFQIHDLYHVAFHGATFQPGHICTTVSPFPAYYNAAFAECFVEPAHFRFVAGLEFIGRKKFTRGLAVDLREISWMT